MNPVVQYKTRVASRYFPVHPDGIGMKITEADHYFTSIKYNGHFGIVTVKKGKAVIFGSDGSEKSIPSIEKAALKLNKDFTIAGEICCFKDGVSQTNIHVAAALDEPHNFDLRFAVFDILEWESNNTSDDFTSKYKKMKSAFNDEVLFCVEQHLHNSRKDIIDFYKKNIENNEGVITRSSGGITYKIKPIITIDLVVLGYALKENEDSLRELLLGLVVGDNQYQIVTRCSSGFTEKERVDILNKLKPLHCDSSYTEVSGAKTAFIMIKPELVVEIKSIDLLDENTLGSIRKMRLGFDQNSGYEKLQLSNSFSCISPVFICFREDKIPSIKDAGFSQVAHLIDEKILSKQTDNLIPSEVVHAESYTKSGKGGMAVRKFTVIKTNKEKTGLYAPFNVVYTDFGAGRKAPLEQDLFLCSTEKEALKKVELLKEEIIKKGWELHK
jgi:hypothetical protein